MNKLSRLDPYTELQRFYDDVNRLVRSTFMGEGTDITASSQGFETDIYEDDKEVKLVAELPGIKGDDVEISVENNILTISGEKKFEDEKKKDKYLRIERYYGKYTRSFSLPAYVDSSKISAEHKNGVLTIHMPKKPETRPRMIKVKSSD